MHARQCSRDLLALKPTMRSWVPHVACSIVTRQIVDMGDPTRRSADSCESFGAVLKKVIKHLTCRRRTTSELNRHSARGGGKVWHQTFRKGYVEQSFGRMCVRSNGLLHGAVNKQYLGLPTAFVPVLVYNRCTSV